MVRRSLLGSSCLPWRDVSIHEPVGNDSDLTLEHLCVDQSNPPPWEALHRDELLEGLRYGLSKLTEREQYVLEHRWELNDSPVLPRSELAVQLGVSESMVTQIEVGARRKLRRYIDEYLSPVKVKAKASSESSGGRRGMERIVSDAHEEADALSLVDRYPDLRLDASGRLLRGAVNPVTGRQYSLVQPLEYLKMNLSVLRGVPYEDLRWCVPKLYKALERKEEWVEAARALLGSR
ncbi:MAG: hypothetical protein HC945_00780 [Nitrosarchaeum sp.]|nr:hypothetical protein [Nitrosarchaeum sp.]